MRVRRDIPWNCIDNWAGCSATGSGCRNESSASPLAKRPPASESSKTVRFRAAQVEGARQLLRAALHHALHGQAYEVYWNRLDKLADINELDLLADAGQ